MKASLKAAVLLASTSAMVIGCLGGDKYKKKEDLKSTKDKVSYVIGQQIGQGLKGQSIDVDTEILAQSIREAVAGGKSMLTDDEMRGVLTEMNQEMMKKRVEEGKVNKEKGDKFLEENKKKEGVQSTASGLQYQIVEAGSGDSPGDNDKVKVHYKGTLIDGKEFDSSAGKDPVEFQVGQVIRGWTEGLKMMKKGAKWKLFIPSDLAYGPMGRPGIPANSVLLFDVELIDITKGTAAEANPMAKKGSKKK